MKNTENLNVTTPTGREMEVRDAVIKSGMEHGAAESYDKLAELLATLEARSMETGVSIAGA